MSRAARGRAPGPPPGTPALQLIDISKTFDGRTAAVDGCSLDVAPGEFVSLLGPSGCGKTTTLSMIAGLRAADGGRIFIDGRDVTGLPPASASRPWSSRTTPSSRT